MTWIAGGGVGVALATLSAATAPAQLAEPIQSAGGGMRWQLAVEPGSCTLARRFDQPSPVAIELTSDVGTGLVQLKIARPTAKRFRSDQWTAGQLLVDGASMPSERWGAWRIAGDLPDVVSTFVPPATIDRVATATSLSIGNRRGDVGTIPLPAINHAIAALHRCEREQLIEWGADPDQFLPGGTLPAAIDPDRWLSDKTWSTIDLPHTPSSLVLRTVLLLSSEGMVERCTVPDKVAGNFEQVACKALLGRRVARPALAPGGRPVRGVVTMVNHMQTQAVTVVSD